MSKPGLIHADDLNDGDPSIQGRTVRVMFVESKYNYQTTINGTRDEIANYFVGAKLNVSNGEEIIRTPHRLEFLPETEDGQTIAYTLPSSKCILYRGYNIVHNPPAIPIRSCDWQYAHNGYDGPEDGRCGSAASLEDAKQYIDELIDDELLAKNIGSDL
jgi:hypothetical protein